MDRTTVAPGSRGELFCPLLYFILFTRPDPGPGRHSGRAASSWLCESLLSSLFALSTGFLPLGCHMLPGMARRGCAKERNGSGAQISQFQGAGNEALWMTGPLDSEPFLPFVIFADSCFCCLCNTASFSLIET